MKINFKTTMIILASCAVIVVGSLFILALLSEFGVLKGEVPPAKSEIVVKEKKEGHEIAVMENESKLKSKENTSIKSIAPSLDDLKKRYYENTAKTTLNRNPEFEIKYNTKFSSTLSDHASVIGDLNDDGSVHSLVLFSGNDGSATKIAEQLSIIAALLSVANPEFVPEDRGRILRKLGFFDEDADLTTLDKSYTENGITYKAFYYSVDNVLQFIISPEKPKK